MTSAAEAPHTTRRSPAAILRAHWPAGLGVAASLVSLAVLGWFVTDDAAITLRYARQLADGMQVVWNAGEHPVEGYTNFSHVLLGALAIKLGFPPLESLRVINQACLPVICILVYALALPALRSRMLAAGAAVLVGLHAPLGYWVSSGLETGVYIAAVYAGVLASRRVGTPRAGLYTAVAMLVAALSRLEGPAVVAAIASALVLEAVRARDAAKLRPHLGWIASFSGCYLVYFVWRYHHFGHLLSNSAYFKLDGTYGFTLLFEFAAQNPVLLVLALFADFRKLGQLGLLIGLLAAAYAAGYHNVNDAIAYFHRFLLPLVPGLAILAASCLGRLTGPGARQRPRRVLAALLFALAIAADVLHPSSGFAAAYAKGERLNTRIVSRAAVAGFLAERSNPSQAVAIEDVGVVGFILPNPILDLLGLNDERFTHRFAKDKRAYIRALMDQAPAFAVVVSREPSHLRPKYEEGALVVHSPHFAKHYALATVIASTREGYHYFVFARRTLRNLQPLRRFELPADLTPPARVDRLFALVRLPHSRE